MTTTILLLVSRREYLDEVFEALDKLKCDTTETALLCIVNGEADVFVDARNRTELSKYGESLAIQVKPKGKLRQFDISGRRKRIASLHNEAKQYITTDYVFGVEDDTIIPPNALEKLGEQYLENTGMIQGVEMGRWGVPYIGAWKADDIYEPTEITSLELSDKTEVMHAGGFYCFLTRADYYKEHDFKPFDNNGLGPDVDFSLSLARKGLENLTDFTVRCIHKDQKRGDVSFDNTTPRIISMVKTHRQWVQKIRQQ